MYGKGKFSSTVGVIESGTSDPTKGVGYMNEGFSLASLAYTSR